MSGATPSISRRVPTWDFSPPTATRGRSSRRSASASPPPSRERRSPPLSRDPAMRVILDSVGPDTTVYKSHRLVEWNGKKYRLTHLFNDGAETHQIGFTDREWNEIETQQIAMWNAAQAADAQFAFTNSSFHVESRTWKYRPAAQSPITTVDATDPSVGRTIAAIQPHLMRVKDLGRPMKFVRGNPPRPRLAHQRPPAPPSPPPAPLVPPVAPPAVIPWYRIDQHLKKLFNL